MAHPGQTGGYEGKMMTAVSEVGIERKRESRKQLEM